MLPQKKIFRLWTPLALTWLMMACEGPLLAAIVARLDEPTFNLAAYGVAFSIALIMEAPVIMILSAATALVRDLHSYLLLRNFTIALSLGCTVLMLILCLPAVFQPLSTDWIGLPEGVSRLTQGAIILMLPWPGTIGIRRFYQGLLIRFHRTRLVALGTAIRLTTMATVSLLLFLHSNIAGASVAAIALSSGVTVEALASRLMAHGTIQELARQDVLFESLSYRGISAFYYPLALTSFLVLGVQPLVTFFVGHSREAIASLAVLPVVNALVFIFRSLGLALQEIVVALLGNELQGFEPLLRFTRRLMLVSAVGLGFIVFTPLKVTWFQSISGLKPDLAALAVDTARIMFPLPAFAVLLSFQRGFLVHIRRTKSITWATLLEVGTVVLLLFVCIRYLDLVGSIAAGLALLIGRAASCGYLRQPVRRSLNLFPGISRQVS